MNPDGNKSEYSRPSGTAPIQVLNLSFPRSGTMTVQVALNELGYKCWHSTLCFGDNAQCYRWVDALDAKYLHKGTPFTPADWDAIFRGYNAVSADPPAFGFVPELISAYPDAKVILVERDEDAWFKSFEATTMSHLFRWDLWAAGRLDSELIGPVGKMHRAWLHSWWRVNTKDEMRAKARMMYRQHNQTVRNVTPAGNLLVFRLEDGWGPLCEFLGKAIPETSFPVKNDRSQVKVRNHWIRIRGLQILTRNLVMVFGPVLVCVLGWWLFAKHTAS